MTVVLVVTSLIITAKDKSVNKISIFCLYVLCYISFCGRDRRFYSIYAYDAVIQRSCIIFGLSANVHRYRLFVLGQARLIRLRCVSTDLMTTSMMSPTFSVTFRGIWLRCNSPSFDTDVDKHAEIDDIAYSALRLQSGAELLLYRQRHRSNGVGKSSRGSRPDARVVPQISVVGFTGFQFGR